jgi:GNAT superfamily N-acetyltransferase
MLGSPTSEAIEICSPSDRPEALNILYRQIDPDIRPIVIQDALSNLRSGIIDFSGLWIAKRRGTIIGVLLTQQLAGKAAAVWAPEVQEGWGRATTARRLLAEALRDFRAKGVRIAQALVDPSGPPQAALDLKRGGLPFITELHYMKRLTAKPILLIPPSITIQWDSYRTETRDQFQEILKSTYIGSLDMPELEGTRSLDEVIEGHKAVGRFYPQRWQIGILEENPRAAIILLLSDTPGKDAFEITYLGLTPQARGRGLGLITLDYARKQAEPLVDRLELAVDIRNIPAMKLYKKAGFRVFTKRLVHIALL